MESAGFTAPKSFSPRSLKTPFQLRQAGSRFSTIGLRLFLLLAIAAVGYAIYLIFQPPPEIPQPFPPASAEESARLANFLRDASKSSGGAWQVEENAINRFLAANLRLSSVDNPIGIKVAFNRCYIALHEGRMDFTMQVAVFDRSLFLRITLAPAPKGSGLGIRVVGAALGQLPIPGSLAQFLLPLWSPCFGTLEDVLAILKKADSAEVSPKRLVVRWSASSLR